MSGMKLFEDKEFERLQEEDWINLAIGSMRYRAHEEHNGKEIVIPTEVVKKSLHFTRACANLNLRIDTLNEYVFDKLGITRRLEKELWRKKRVVEYSLPQSIHMHHEMLAIPAKINTSKLMEDPCRLISMLIELSAFYNSRYSVIRNVVDIINDGRISQQDLKTKRSRYFFQHACYDLTTNIIKNNTWNIKSLGVLLDLTEWITNSAQHNSIYANMMLTRIKAMTHSGNPIYSVKRL